MKLIGKTTKLFRNRFYKFGSEGMKKMSIDNMLFNMLFRFI